MKEKTKNLKVNKLKFIKESRIKHEIIAGGCTSCSGCWKGTQTNC